MSEEFLLPFSTRKLNNHRSRRFVTTSLHGVILPPPSRTPKGEEKRKIKDEMFAADDINNTLAEAYGNAIDRREKMNRVRFDGSESARSSEIT
ncbi:hypothetical protein CEXT_377991 [Caerostris extrusa]|uniref:Uncharacterized protein n=1 Tax=Caerostris extrusa TaxID=172846 RepID=A0AAV4WVV9_CAEEX|nr:hypothetical protein CEXT_377991 [Caerostris extrusa]